MVAGHRDIHALIIRKSAALDKADRAEGQMNGYVIFFATSRFAGMAADTVVGIKIETVLFITIGIFANAGIAVNAQAFIPKLAARFSQFDVLTVAVLGLAVLSLRKA